MNLLRDHDHQDLCASSVVAIGNFDGVHRGHQALLSNARTLQEPGDALALVSFEPLPKAFFTPEQAPARLMGPAQKLRFLRGQGVDLAWLLRFNKALASMEPEAFIERILVRGLRARGVVVGGDFRFGRARQGDLALLRDLGEAFGYETIEVPAVCERGERISSSALRKALAEGHFKRAEAYLGRPYSVEGRVVRGAQLGRRLGYPTANIRPWRGSTPLHGVFAVRARLPGKAWLDGVASVGVRPAVGGGEPLIEVHLFDFSGDLYGCRLEVRFLSRLRGEEDFPEIDALVRQMKQDEARARTLLARAPGE